MKKNDSRRATIIARMKLAVYYSGMTIPEISQKAGINRSTIQQYLYYGVMPGADKL